MPRSPVTAPVPAAPEKRRLKPVWLWLTLCSVAALSAGGWVMRKDIAAELVRGWLKGQGVDAADVQFDSLGLTHLTGRINLGREASIRRFDADYRLRLPFGGHALVTLTRLRVVHPVGQISYKNGKFGFGSLDTLIRNALSARPSGAAPPHEIIIEDANIAVQSDYGLIRTYGSLTLHDGMLSDLRLIMPETRLDGTMGQGEAVGGLITARSVGTVQNGDQLQIQARFTADSLDARMDLISPVNADHQKAHLQGVVLTVDGRLPYRQSKTLSEAFSGPARADIGLKAEGFQGQAAYINGLEAVLRLEGQLQTTASGLTYRGPARMVTQMDHLETGTLDSQDIGLIAPDMTLAAGWDVVKGASLEMTGPVTGHLGLLRQGDLFAKDARLDLNRVRLNADVAGGDLAFKGALFTQRLAAGDLSLEQTHIALIGKGYLATSNRAYSLSVTSDITSDQGQYSGLSAIAAARGPDKKAPPRTPQNAPTDGIYALDRAFQRFSLRAKGLTYHLSGERGLDPHFDLRLQSPATINLRGGGQLTVAPTSQPLIASREAGGFDIQLGGTGLPEVALSVAQFGFDPNNAFILSGLFNLTAAFDTAPLTGAKATAKGRFTLTDQQAVLVTLDGPGHLTAESAELGEHLKDVALDLTQGKAPFFRYDATGWHVSGNFDNLSLSAPNEALRFAKAAGIVEAYAIPGCDAPGLRAVLTQGTLSDATSTPNMRLHPLLISGTLTQDAQALKGRFVAATPSHMAAGKPLSIAAINLDNIAATGKGSLAFRTLGLSFTPGGLQPTDLSPLVTDIMRKDVSGEVAFTGAFSWDPKGNSSGGVLSIDSLNFTGVAGVTQGLKTQMVFNSLAPLTTAPGQTVHIDRVQLSVPVVTDLNFAVQLMPDHLAVERAILQTPGGPLTIEPMSVPFDSHAAISGAITFKGLDFGRIVAATDLKDSIQFEGRLSGHIPFRFDNAQLSVAQGVMSSDAPGRIAIKRADLTAVAATGNLTASTTDKAAALPVDPAFNPFQDMAYQAMEHIAFDKIDARMNSVPGGALDTTFHIKGYFDPPQAQKATVAFVDYLNGSWMTKPIKLPSKTPIELYLDVPLRLDGILSDLLAKTSAPPTDKKATDNK